MGFMSQSSTCPARLQDWSTSVGWNRLRLKDIIISFVYSHRHRIKIQFFFSGKRHQYVWLISLWSLRKGYITYYNWSKMKKRASIDLSILKTLYSLHPTYKPFFSAYDISIFFRESDHRKSYRYQYGLIRMKRDNHRARLKGKAFQSDPLEDKSSFEESCAFYA